MEILNHNTGYLNEESYMERNHSCLPLVKVFVFEDAIE